MSCERCGTLSKAEAKRALRNEKRTEAERIIKELRRRDCCENLIYSVAKIRLTVLQDKITAEDGQVLITAEELDELERVCAEKWVEYYFSLLKEGCTVYEPEYTLSKMMEYDSLAGKKLSRTKIRQAERYASQNVAIVKAQDMLDELVRCRHEFPPNVHAKVDELLMYMTRHKLPYCRLEARGVERLTKRWVLEINNMFL